MNGNAIDYVTPNDLPTSNITPRRLGEHLEWLVARADPQGDPQVPGLVAGVVLRTYATDDDGPSVWPAEAAEAARVAGLIADRLRSDYEGIPALVDHVRELLGKHGRPVYEILVDRNDGLGPVATGDWCSSDSDRFFSQRTEAETALAHLRQLYPEAEWILRTIN